MVKEEPPDDEDQQLLSHQTSPISKEPRESNVSGESQKTSVFESPAKSNAITECSEMGPWSFDTSFCTDATGIIRSNEEQTSDCAKSSCGKLMGVIELTKVDNDDIVNNIIHTMSMPEDQQDVALRTISCQPRVRLLGANVQAAATPMSQQKTLQETNIQHVPKDEESGEAIIITDILIGLDSKERARKLTKIMLIGQRHNLSK